MGILFTRNEKPRLPDSYDGSVATPAEPPRSLGLKAGNRVRVRSKDEILRTLDSEGKLEGVPFMPEMLRFCGREFPVRARAHKVCDTIEWQEYRRMEHAVHLAELRCDGSAHGGCDAGCLFFWKEAWLSPLEDDAQEVASSGAPVESVDGAASISEEDLFRATEVGTNEAGQTLYSCQATEVLQATKGPLRWWEPTQYVEDLTSGNSTLRRVIRALLVGAFNRFQQANARFLPRFCLIQGCRRYPFIKGTAPRGETPEDTLGLQPGEIVEIKSKEEIFATLDDEDKTRGLRYDSEMLRYCGRRARVVRRIERIIDEKSGRMLRIKRDCVILDGVICTGEFHRSCPRAIYPYWREVWLKRVDPASEPAGEAQACAVAQG
jgi:hypothetical protein